MKRAVLYVSIDLLTHLFLRPHDGYYVHKCIYGLPPDAKFISKFIDENKDAVGIVYESGHFDEVADGSDLPAIEYTVESTPAPEDGKHYWVKVNRN